MYRKMLLFMFFLLGMSLFGADYLEMTKVEESSDELVIGSLVGERSGTIKELSGEFGDLSVRESSNGLVVKLEGLQNKAIANNPALPQKQISLTFKGNYDITGLELLEQTILQTKLEDKLAINLRQVKWKNRVSTSMIASKSADEVSPGKWFSYSVGFDGKETKVFIQLRPLQWVQENQKIYLLKDYKIKIYGQRKQNCKFTNTRDIPSTNASHLLICPEAWALVADSIATFHGNNGIATDVITLEDISSSYEEVENPQLTGIANTENQNIENYDFSLAKKIIAYLRDNSKHPYLENVTLLGSGHILPPSYYFYYPYLVPFEDMEYDGWIPSDHYYSSPDYDLVDNFGTSRVTVSSLQELSNYYHKMIRWVDSWDSSWVYNAAVAGGIPFGLPYFCGELMSNQVICDDLLSGYNIDKFYETKGNFTESDMTNHLKNDDFLWQMHVSHGSGGAVHFDDNSAISVEDVQSYPSKDRLPIFLSVACRNGAYDTEIYHGDWAGESFGEALIRSKGGAIAYIGGSRSNYGMSDYNVDHGNISYIGVNDTFALIYYYLEAYRELENPTMGDLYREAKIKYLASQDMGNTFIQAGYFRFVALTDAGLILPAKPNFIEQDNVPRIILEGSDTHGYIGQIASVTSSNGPIYNVNTETEYIMNSYDIETDYYWETFWMDEYSSLVSDEIVSSQFNIPLNNGNHVILNRLEDSNCKEAFHFSELDVNITSNADDSIPAQLNVQVYPNPFNPTTSISFCLDKKSNVCAKIYNIKGQKVRTLIDEECQVGKHTVHWNGVNDNNEEVSSAIYFLDIKTYKYSFRKKLLLLK